MRRPPWPHLRAAPSLLGFGDGAPGSYWAGTCKKHAREQFGFSAGQKKPFLQSNLWQKAANGVSYGTLHGGPAPRQRGLQPPSSFRSQPKGRAAGWAPRNPTDLIFYLQKPPRGPPGPARRSSKCPHSQHYVSLPSLPFSLLSCLKTSGSPCTHPEKQLPPRIPTPEPRN